MAQLCVDGRHSIPARPIAVIYLEMFQSCNLRPGTTPCGIVVLFGHVSDPPRGIFGPVETERMASNGEKEVMKKSRFTEEQMVTMNVLGPILIVRLTSGAPASVEAGAVS
ncbi:hypothetical protein [Burkholderia sp. NLJ2]|uniref:hypothetical protein n=1 Tax=Burkholderia sp. NLJ2 TaxID=3090699 RepID=UPI003C6CC404